MTSVVNRYYDPTTDQFLSIDPDVPTTGQPYVFTNDDPLNGVDPLGLAELGVGNGANEFEVPDGYSNSGNGETGQGEGGNAGEGGQDSTKGEDKGNEGEADLKFNEKIKGQLEGRGWTEEEVKETVDDPKETHQVKDLHTDPPTEATAYESKGGGNVVVNDETGEVVQVSDRYDSDWKDPWNDPKFL